MELIILCVTMTMIMAVLLVGIGVALARMDKRELDGDTDTRLYVPSRCRNRRGDNRHDLQMESKAEEVISGLQNLRMALSRTEKEWLDYACDCVLRVEKESKNEDG